MCVIKVENVISYIGTSVVKDISGYVLYLLWVESQWIIQRAADEKIAKETWSEELFWNVWLVIVPLSKDIPADSMSV